MIYIPILAAHILAACRGIARRDISNGWYGPPFPPPSPLSGPSYGSNSNIDNNSGIEIIYSNNSRPTRPDTMDND